MPVVQPNNAYTVALHKQTNEATPGTVGDYSFPVFSSSLSPRYDERRVEVTDASSIQADTYKGLTYWDGEIEFPGFSAGLGRAIQSLYPTDTKTGVGPYVHTFSGAGGTQPWVSMYDTWTAGSLASTFGKGLCTGMSFSANQDGGPVRVRFAAMGQVPSVAAYTVTTPHVLADGYFTLQSATASVKIDLDTPNATPTVSYTNVESVRIDVNRTAAAAPTVDGTTVSNIDLGKLEPGGEITFLWNDWEAYQATYLGAVAGTTASSVTVKGALKLNFTHTVAADTFSLEIPAVQFKAERPQPSPAGDPIKVTCALNIQKPTSGDHVIPVLTNSVATAY